MDVYQTLKQDHDRIRGYLDELMSSAELATRRSLRDRIVREMRAHHQIEGQLLVPLLQDAEVTKDLIADMHTRHETIDKMVDQLDQASLQGHLWTLDCRPLQEQFGHDAQQEEGKLFPQAQKVIPQTRAAELGKQCEEMRQKLVRS